MILLMRFARLWKSKTSRARKQFRSSRPVLEAIEERCLLAWSPIGPAPLLQSQADFSGVLSEAVTGRVTALALGQDNAGQPALFLGPKKGSG